MQPPLAHRVFGADLRALAIFRIALGMLCLYDILNRSLNLTAHYTDAGVLPRTELIGRAPHLISLHHAAGDWPAQAVLFAIAAAASVALIAGARTFLATAVLFVLTVSVQNRNPMVIYGADVLLRALLFWSLFLPLSARWSVDRRADRAPTFAGNTILSGGTIALLLQVIIVYLFTGLLKTGPAWFDGTAVHNALHIDKMARSLAGWWLGHPELLKTLTPTVRLFEIYGPLLLLCPVWPGRVRLVVILGFIGLHLGIGTALDLGLWPWCGVAALIPLLPSFVFNRWHTGPPAPDAPPEETTAPAIGPRRRWLGSSIALIAIAFVAWWNVAGLPNAPVTLPRTLQNVGVALRLDQHWNMFAPQPLTDDGWFVIEGTLADGTPFDPLTGSPPTFDKPPLAFHRRLNDRWQKYYHSLWLSDHAWAVDDYARWLCRHWNPPAATDTALQSFDIYYMLEQTTPPGGSPLPIEDVLVWEHTCSEDTP